jgi:hypothetical protein
MKFNIYNRYWRWRPEPDIKSRRAPTRPTSPTPFAKKSKKNLIKKNEKLA